MSFWRIETQDSLQSTQDYIRVRAEDGEPEGLAVRAVHQSGGRGRHGRVWEAGEGNLYTSFLITPNISDIGFGPLSLSIGLGVYQAIMSLCPEFEGRMQLKWPNDLILDRKKLAGILLEAGDNFIVVGIGINITHAPIEGSIALAQATEIYPAADTMYLSVLSEVEKYYKRLRSEGFDALRREWLSRGHKVAEPLTVKVSQRHYSGTFYNIDEDGSLVLKCNDEFIKLNTGDVFDHGNQ